MGSLEPGLSVVVGDVVFIVLVLLACLFIAGVGVLAVYSLARAARCRSCHRWTTQAPSGQQTLCRACLESHLRAEAARAAGLQVSMGAGAGDPHGLLVHDILERHLPRHHELVHGESSP